MLNIYIADDEVWIILGLQKLLEKSGYDVRIAGSANNGLTAREEIARLLPDVVFTDIRMPGMGGLELLSAIHEVSPDTLVVMISGYEEFSYAQKAVQEHAFDYLVKPIKQEEIDRVLANVLKERSGQAPYEEVDGAAVSDRMKANGAAVSDRIKVDGAAVSDRMRADGTAVSDRMRVGGAAVSDRMIDSVLEVIRQHYTEDIQLTTLAAQYSISSGRLSTIIKDELQMTFSDYIAQLRIQRAKELLRDELLSIQEIAERVGYNDYYYFTKVFKKVQGISPSKYRKLL